MRKGYALQVTSWENDGDNYNTITMDGLSKEDVPIIITFCTLFYSKSNNNGGLGNSSYSEQYLIDTAVGNFEKEYPELANQELQYDLGLGGNEYYAARVFDSVKVLYIPVDIEDVTKDFIQ